MSNLQQDTNKDRKLTVLCERLLQATCQKQFLKIDLTKIKNVQILKNAISEFDELYHNYLDVCPLGSTNEDTLKQYDEQFNTFLSLFCPHLAIIQPNKFVDDYALVLHIQDAKHAWKKWSNEQPLNRPLRESYDVPTNRGITEKFLHNELGLQEWLSEPDIKRMLSAMDLTNKVHLTRLTTQDLGIVLHYEREKHVNPAADYQIPLIVNLGIDSHSNHQQQGYHWARMVITVKTKTNEIIVNYKDSLKLSSTEKKFIEEQIVKAVSYQEKSIEANHVKHFAAFPGFTIKTNCLDSGEQADSWTCGYRALKGVADDLDIEHPIAHCQTNQEMRDCVYSTILQKAEFQETDLAKTKLAHQTSLFYTANNAKQLKQDIIEGVILQLKELPAAKEHSRQSLAEADLKELVQVNSLATKISQLPIFKLLSKESPVKVDFQQLLQQGLKKISASEKISDNIIQTAFVKCLFRIIGQHNQLKEWRIENFAALDPKAQQTFFEELEKSPFVTKLESSDQNLKAQAQIITARNKVIAFYDVDVSGEDVDCWNAAVHAYFNDIPTSTTGARYLQLYKEFAHPLLGPQSLTDSQQELLRAMATMGPIWFKKLLQFIRENRNHFDSTPFPYRGFNFNTSALSQVGLQPNLDPHFINVLSEEINHPNQYLPFKSMYFRGYAFEQGAFDAIKNLLQQLNKSPLESCDFYTEGNDTGTGKLLPNARLSVEQLDEIIELTQQQKLKTIIGFQYDRTDENKERIKTLENIIARNRRESAKQARALQLGLKEEKIVITSTENLQQSAPLKPIRGRIRAYKLDKSAALNNVAVEVQHQSQMQQQIEVQQQQNRQQQIQQQQERQKANQSAFGEIGNENLIDRSKIEVYENYYQHITLGGSGEVADFWDEVVGPNAQHLANKIQKMTPDAFTTLIKYHYLFKGGMNLDNLPRGFFLQKNHDNQWVLCFDRVKYLENKNESPLTINYVAKKVYAAQLGDDRQLVPHGVSLPKFSPDGPTTQEKMALEDPFYYQRIDLELNDIKTGMNDRIWRRFDAVLYEEGTLGIYALFQNFKKIKSRSEETFNLFKQAFIEKIDNATEFLQQDYIDAINKISLLDDRKLAWWNALSRQHCENFNSPNLPDIFNAFEYFCNELEKIHPNFKLPIPCPLSNVKNMKVSLDRLLTILNNAIDIQEQLLNLEGIVLDAEGAFYASRYEGFYLVTKEMLLQPQILNGLGEGQDFVYRVKYDQLTDTTATYNDLKILFFRYLGHLDCEPYLAPYQNYVNLINHLDLANNINDEIKKHLIPILASATTGPRAYQLNIDSVSKQFLRSIQKLDPQSACIILDEFAKWHDVYPRINLTEFAEFIEILKDIPDEDIPVIAQRLKDHISPGFLQAISKKTKNKNSIPLHAFLGFVDTLSETINDVAVVDKATIILATVNNTLRDEQQKNDFIAAINNLHSNPNTSLTHNILDILGSIDLEKSKALPTLSKFTAIIEHTTELDNPNYNTLYQFIAKSLPDCSFNISNNNLSLKIDLNELIAQNLDNIINYIEQNKVPFIKIEELRGPKAADYLMEMVKKFDNHIPDILKTNLKNLFRANHEQELIAYAQSKLPNYGNEIQSLINKKINDDLFTQKLPLMQLISGIEDRFLQTSKLIDLVSKIHTKWPEVTKHIFEVLNNAMYTNTIAIESITRIMQVIFEHTKDFKYPHGVLHTILNHPTLTKLSQKEATILQDVLTQVMADQKSDIPLKEKIVNLALINLRDPNIRKFTTNLLEYRNDDIYKLLIANSSTLADLNDAKTKTDQLIAIFSNLPEKQSATQQRFFRCMACHPDDFLIISDTLQHIEAEKQAYILKIATFAGMNTNIYYKDKILELIALLEDKSSATLAALAKLYDAKPFPLIDKLFDIAAPNFAIDQFIIDFQKDPYGRRSQPDVLAQHFDATRVRDTIEHIDDLSRDRKLSLPHKTKLLKAFHYINMIGLSHPVQTNPINPVEGRLAPLKECSRQELVSLIAYYKQQLSNDTLDETRKKRLRLEYLATVREVMYRTTGMFPKSTQMLSVLNAVMTGGNLLAEIRTGEGKGITTALFAAMLWGEGQTVDVCTSNSALAQRDLIGFGAFYDYLGAKSTLITADSNPREYCVNGINYSDVGQLALFQSRAKLEGFTNIVSGKASLVLDEADFTIFDDVTQYRYAVNLDATLDPYLNLDAWLYPFINDFVDTEIFKDPTTSAAQDIENLRIYLMTKAGTSSQKDRINELSQQQLDTWLDSAFAASQLRENIHYVVKEEVRKIDNDNVKLSMARLLINERVSPSAQYSNGVQQFLHARLNKKIIAENTSQPYFPIDPEKAHVSSISSKNFIDQYRRKDQRQGQVWGMTGTIGSEEERREQEEKYGFSLFRMPPHDKSLRIEKNISKPILAKNSKQHQQKIVEHVIKRLRRNPPAPVLLICKDIPSANALHELIAKELKKRSNIQGKYNLQLYNSSKLLVDGKEQHLSEVKNNNNESAQNDSVEDQVVSRAGNAGMITISTTMLGRGTDFKPVWKKKTDPGSHDHSQVLPHPTGLTVIQTYVDSERSTGQIIGRAGRQGQPGEAIMIVNAEEFSGVTQKNKVTERKLPTLIKTLRNRHNEKFKQQRQYRERFSDVRNQVFEQFLTLIDTVIESDLENKAQMRKNLLQSWEHYLNGLDKKWTDIALQKDSPQLEECVKQIAEYACSQWGRFVDKAAAELQEGPLKLSDNLRLDKDRIFNNVFTPATKPQNKNENIEATLPLPEALNHDQIYLDMVPEANQYYFVDGVEVSKRSTVWKFNQVFHDLKNTLVPNSLLNHVTPENLYFKTRKMFELIFDAQHDSFGTEKNKTRSRETIEKYYQKLLSIVRDSKDPNLQFVTFDAHRINYQDRMMYRNKVHSQTYLQILNQQMLAAQQQGLFGNFDIELAKDEHSMSTNRSVMVKMLRDYQQGYFVAQDRKDNVAALITSLGKIDLTNVVKDPMIYTDKLRQFASALNHARAQALIADLSANKKAWFFNRNKFGSRYQTVLEKIRERFVAGCDSNSLDKLVGLEFEDLRNIVESFRLQINHRKYPDIHKLIKKAYSDLTTADISLDNIDDSTIQKISEKYQVVLKLQQDLLDPKVSDSNTKNFVDLINKKCQQINMYLQQTNRLRLVLAKTSPQNQSQQMDESTLRSVSKDIIQDGDERVVEDDSDAKRRTSATQHETKLLVKQSIFKSQYSVRPLVESEVKKDSKTEEAVVTRPSSIEVKQ